ncbi:hypothetical protein M9H77_26056 [Catharanthus roseus]|uniref:Uncharacterized protein n=1 Tax=Catharanthus roseus TaxID=4058 RepID=A0ACC0ACV3_CATRO|nr:hypothetical protein M9H77_26056 [Catharanthus roseus]
MGHNSSSCTTNVPMLEDQLGQQQISMLEHEQIQQQEVPSQVSNITNIDVTKEIHKRVGQSGTTIKSLSRIIIGPRSSQWCEFSTKKNNRTLERSLVGALESLETLDTLDEDDEAIILLSFLNNNG